MSSISYNNRIRNAYADIYKLSSEDTVEINNLSDILNSIVPTDSYEFGFVDAIMTLNKDPKFVKTLSNTNDVNHFILFTGGKNIAHHFSLRLFNIQYNLKSNRFVVTKKKYPKRHTYKNNYQFKKDANEEFQDQNVEAADTDMVDC